MSCLASRATLFKKWPICNSNAKWGINSGIVNRLFENKYSTMNTNNAEESFNIEGLKSSQEAFKSVTS